MQMKHYSRLPLQKAYNVRDLGGYPAQGGTVTRWGVFLRGDDLCELPVEDIGFLREYGVTAVMDLRSGDEISKFPDPFALTPDVIYRNISLMSGNVGDMTKVLTQNPQSFIREFYLHLVKEAHEELKAVLDFFAEQTQGTVLFHCAAGKDRTGIVAMLLLGLAGVGKYDIIANYEITGTYLRNNPAYLKDLGDIPPDVMYSKAEYIEPALDYILEDCGGFDSYFAVLGVAVEARERIKDRLLEEP